MDSLFYLAICLNGSMVVQHAVTPEGQVVWLAGGTPDELQPHADALRTRTWSSRYPRAYRARVVRRSTVFPGASADIRLDVGRCQAGDVWSTDGGPEGHNMFSGLASLEDLLLVDAALHSAPDGPIVGRNSGRAYVVEQREDWARVATGTLPHLGGWVRDGGDPPRGASGTTWIAHCYEGGAEVVAGWDGEHLIPPPVDRQASEALGRDLAGRLWQFIGHQGPLAIPMAFPQPSVSNPEVFDRPEQAVIRMGSCSDKRFEVFASEEAVGLFHPFHGDRSVRGEGPAVTWTPDTGQGLALTHRSLAVPSFDMDCAHLSVVAPDGASLLDEVVCQPRFTRLPDGTLLLTALQSTQGEMSSTDWHAVWAFRDGRLVGHEAWARQSKGC